MKRIILLLSLMISNLALADQSTFQITTRELRPDQSTVIRSSRKLPIGSAWFIKRGSGNEADVQIRTGSATSDSIYCQVTTSELAALQLVQMIKAGDINVACDVTGPNVPTNSDASGFLTLEVNSGVHADRYDITVHTHKE